MVDLAKGHLSALYRLAVAPGLHIWNLGTGRGTSVLELVAAFERAASLRIPYEITERRSGDVAETWADPSKASRELDWKADLTVDDMCADSWRWQQFALGLD